MHGSMNIKFVNAKQAIEIHAYKNTKTKLYKTNAAIWFNKTFRDNYINQRMQIQAGDFFLFNIH
jgi:hypothetical protein